MAVVRRCRIPLFRVGVWPRCGPAAHVLDCPAHCGMAASGRTTGTPGAVRPEGSSTLGSRFEAGAPRARGTSTIEPPSWAVRDEDAERGGGAQVGRSLPWRDQQARRPSCLSSEVTARGRSSAAMSAGTPGNVTGLGHNSSTVTYSATHERARLRAPLVPHWHPDASQAAAAHAHTPPAVDQAGIPAGCTTTRPPRTPTARPRSIRPAYRPHPPQPTRAPGRATLTEVPRNAHTPSAEHGATRRATKSPLWWIRPAYRPNPPPHPDASQAAAPNTPPAVDQARIPAGCTATGPAGQCHIFAGWTATPFGHCGQTWLRGDAKRRDDHRDAARGPSHGNLTATDQPTRRTDGRHSSCAGRCPPVATAARRLPGCLPGHRVPLALSEHRTAGHQGWQARPVPTARRRGLAGTRTDPHQ